MRNKPNNQHAATKLEALRERRMCWKLPSYCEPPITNFWWQTKIKNKVAMLIFSSMLQAETATNLKSLASFVFSHTRASAGDWSIWHPASRWISQAYVLLSLKRAVSHSSQRATQVAASIPTPNAVRQLTKGSRSKDVLEEEQRSGDKRW